MANQFENAYLIRFTTFVSDELGRQLDKGKTRGDSEQLKNHLRKMRESTEKLLGHLKAEREAVNNDV